MPNPDVGDVHVDSLLSTVSVGWKPQVGHFALDIFPQVTVQKQSDIWPKWLKSYMVRDLGPASDSAPTGSAQSMVRAPGTKARNVSFATENEPAYYCVNYALGAEIPDELRANADSMFSLDSDYLAVIQSLMALRFDRMFTADFITTGVWTTAKAGTTDFTKWSDYAASTPIEDMRGWLDTLSQYTLGMSDSGGIKVIMGPLVERRLLDHPDIIDRIKYSNSPAAPTKVNRQIIASLLEVDQIIVPKVMYTSDEEGTAEASVTYSRLLSDQMLILYTPPQTRLTPAAGYMFNWASASSGGIQYVRRGRVEREKYDWIEVHSYLDWVKQEADSGVYVSDAVD